MSFASVEDQWRDLSIAPRLARWDEVEGKPEQARWLLRQSIATASREPSMPREQMAWFRLRAGDLELRSGKPVNLPAYVPVDIFPVSVEGGVIRLEVD